MDCVCGEWGDWKRGDGAGVDFIIRKRMCNSQEVGVPCHGKTEEVKPIGELHVGGPTERK